MFTEQLTQALSIPVASIPPANYAANATPYQSGAIDMSVFRRLMGHLQIGAVTGNAAFYFQVSNASGGTYSNITSGNTLTLTTANSEGTIEIRADQLPTNNKWVKLTVLVSGTSAFAQATAFAGESGYKPANQYDAANISRLVCGL